MPSALMSVPWPTGESEPASSVNTCITTSSNKGSRIWGKGLADEIRVKGRQMIVCIGIEG